MASDWETKCKDLLEPLNSSFKQALASAYSIGRQDMWNELKDQMAAMKALEEKNKEQK